MKDRDRVRDNLYNDSRFLDEYKTFRTIFLPFLFQQKKN